MAFCSNCGARVDESASFCANCGHALKSDVVPAASFSDTDRLAVSRMVIFGLVLTVGVTKVPAFP